MLNKNLLKAEMLRNNFDRVGFCKAINMSESTFARRLSTGIFKTDEVEKIIDVLHIDNPAEIFFASN